MSENLAIFLDRAKFYATDFATSLCSVLCKPSSELKINGRTFQIVKLLGEGGFSFVYLAHDQSTGRTFALKKIRCPSGDVVKIALAEIEAYKRFRSNNIITVLDSAVVQDESGEGKIIWVFLPYYERGNLQDMISRSLLTNPPTHPPERQLLSLFYGTCLAVQSMHHYKPSHAHAPTASGSDGSVYPPAAKFVSDSQAELEFDEEGGMLLEGRGGKDDIVFDLGDEEEEQDLIQKVDLKGKGREVVVEENDAEDDEEVPYAHRDIKRDNIMIADDGKTPILMDLGSCVKARIHLRTRQEALIQQDVAAEHSSMPYRAPELFEPKTGQTLDEKVDIWSLGCTLFALAYNYSPFEDPAQAGGSISMAVASGSYRHPRDSPYSQEFKDLIDSMLVVKVEKRARIDQVLERTKRLLEEAQ
ncbi:other nak protein kinase [Phaffia rhodozyma]|uniref:non-specific serine/threonine protein kinase n=1 Tax=Phaffia rhodozyma TaxID=264483 RepID=A0A0F7SQI8_PHARH|nr:other nak protein kinase [Phaffia rhodozyma]